MTMKKTVPLTPALLRRIIDEEVNKFGVEKVEDHDDDAVEVDADEQGTDKALEKHVDFAKALKKEEKRLVTRLAKVREAKSRTLKLIASKIS